jgi:hypothetical protein
MVVWIRRRVKGEKEEDTRIIEAENEGSTGERPPEVPRPKDRPRDLR